MRKSAFHQIIIKTAWSIRTIWRICGSSRVSTLFTTVQIKFITSHIYKAAYPFYLCFESAFHIRKLETLGVTILLARQRTISGQDNLNSHLGIA